MPNDKPSITYQFANLQALNNAFMSFVRDGGIFIPTENEFHLGERVIATITLPESGETYEFTGEIIWITPKSTQSSIHKPGIGVQCEGDEGSAFNKAVQTLLANIKEDPTPDTI